MCTGIRCFQPFGEMGRSRRGWGGSDILRTRTFPELLLCIHGDGGCHLLYFMLSLPLLLSRSHCLELEGERWGGSDFRDNDWDVKKWALQLWNHLHSPSCGAWSWRTLEAAAQQGRGGRGDGTRNSIVLKFTYDPGNDQSYRPKDVSGSCSAHWETCFSSQFLFETSLPEMEGYGDTLKWSMSKIPQEPEDLCKNKKKVLHKF